MGICSIGWVTILMLSAFLLKHFIADFCLQNAYQVLNKGKYGHPGGLLHALIATALSGVALAPFYYLDPFWAAPILTVLAVEFVAHYHIDWLKARATAWLEVTTADKSFWVLIGADQLFHYLTYVWMIWYLLAL